MENFNKELRENLESKIENVNKTLSLRVDTYKVEAEKTIIETNQRLDKTEEKMEQIKTGIDARMDREEQSNQVRIMAIRQENNDQLDGIKSNLNSNSKFTDFNETVENVKNRFHSQVEKLDNLQQLQTNLQGEVNRMGLRSTCNAQHTIQDLSLIHICIRVCWRW